jgi:8-oxo-dGTP pyrophosphatase MutT (NUDIX family)
VPHIHALYDFVVSAFLVRRGRVLLVHHRRYDEWLPLGGHIELDEDPEQALHREIREECGLKARILAKAPAVAHPGVKPLPTPEFMDVHDISPSHKHIAFVYFGVVTSDRVRLHAREHREFRWVSVRQLSDPRLRLTKSIRFYCREALRRCARR